MSISVVIPAYRAANTIRRAVDSVINQTHSATEIVVIDDGSPDGNDLQESLKPYGDIVSLIRKENGGAASARNLGIDQAKGDWIAFLDADDYWEPEKLARQIAIADEMPEVQVIGCRWFLQFPGFPRTPDPANTSAIAGHLLNLKSEQAFRAALCVWTGTLMVRKLALIGMKFATEFEPAEDRDLWFRLLSNHTAFILDDYLATYVQEPGGISRSSIDRDCSSMLAVIQQHAKSIGAAEVRHQSAVVYRRWSGNLLSQGRPASAFPIAVHSLSLRPFSASAWWIVLKSASLTVRDVVSSHLANVNQKVSF